MLSCSRFWVGSLARRFGLSPGRRRITKGCYPVPRATPVAKCFRLPRGSLFTALARLVNAKHARKGKTPKRILFEFATAAYFGIAAASIDDNTRLIGALVFAVPLLIILLVDAWTRLIHTNIIMLGTALGILFAATDGFSDLAKSVIGLLIGLGIFVGFFVLARVIYKSVKVVPFGLGDVYLAAMIGAMVRWPLVLTLADPWHLPRWRHRSSLVGQSARAARLPFPTAHICASGRSS